VLAVVAEAPDAAVVAVVVALEAAFFELLHAVVKSPTARPMTKRRRH
jgi:hypothetical protein